MEVDAKTHVLNDPQIQDQTAYDFMRTVILSLPIEFRDRAGDAGLKAAAYAERRVVLRAAKSGNTAFRDRKLTDLRKSRNHRNLRKTIRVKKIGGGWATVVGDRGARQAWLVNYGHKGGARPRPFVTEHLGKIDQELERAFSNAVRKNLDAYEKAAIRRARVNPRLWKRLLGD